MSIQKSWWFYSTPIPFKDPHSDPHTACQIRFQFLHTTQLFYILDFNANPTARSFYSLKIYVQQETKSGLGRLVVEDSRSHITRTHPPTHTHTQTHTHTHTLCRTTLNERSVHGRARYPHKRQRSWPQRDSNPQPQQSRGRRPTPYIAWPPGSAVWEIQGLITF
jgi:hypothetical protein